MATTDAREMTIEELHEALAWNESLADHYDETDNAEGYHASQRSIQRIRGELDRRARD